MKEKRAQPGSRDEREQTIGQCQIKSPLGLLVVLRITTTLLPELERLPPVAIPCALQPSLIEERLQDQRLGALLCQDRPVPPVGLDTGEERGVDVGEEAREDGA